MDILQDTKAREAPHLEVASHVKREERARWLVCGEGLHNAAMAAERRLRLASLRVPHVVLPIEHTAYAAELHRVLPRGAVVQEVAGGGDVR